ncbi:hypothetical protein OBBRIDRAFT_637966 [Obba rivulosa]|uniref:Uncharacterized protein n=1 Tax=Obba rivulosa TaxID=1052685 RepID=A0A8E2AXF9_9APHY|nr:hypothetical protein OBBRIDRAFT_637966 [Obba rivulosa]
MSNLLPLAETRALVSDPWRPRSIPVDPKNLHRHLCGLLNKINHGNFENISDEIVRWAVTVERTQPTLLEVVAHGIVERTWMDPLRTTLYVDLCQKVVDDLEGERSRWRKVDPYYLGNALHSFEASLQDVAQLQLESSREQGDCQRLLHVSSFLGGIVAHGVLPPEDARQVFNTLLVGIERKEDEFAAAVRRFLKPIVLASDASRILHLLSVVDSLEDILQDENISFKSRFLLMAVLEDSANPAPLDAFYSMEHRAEIYGFGSPGPSIDPADSSRNSPESKDVAQDVQGICREQAQLFLGSHNVESSQLFLQSLPPHNRYHFIASLISRVLFSSDVADAQVLGAFLAQPEVQSLRGQTGSLMSGLQEEIRALDDTVLDNPHATRQMAVILFASGLHPEIIEDTDDHILSRSYAWKRVLDEFFSLEDSQNVGSDPESRADMSDNRSNGEPSDSEAGYTY